MRAKGFLIAGLVSLALGLLGLLVVPLSAAQTGLGGRGFGPGGMMGGWGDMAGMMGGPVPADTRPIGIDRAADAARDYIARFGGQNLELGEVMEFGANYYAQAMERDTGIHAFELLIDKYTGTVFPEMGPSMVWNGKYGHMGGGGMMGWRGFGQGDSTEMPLGPEQARELAAQYLTTQGLRLGLGEPDRFYGYYTLHTLRDGEIEGMLSVNGFTGEVWYHTWHGPFIQSSKSEASSWRARDQLPADWPSGPYRQATDADS